MNKDQWNKLFKVLSCFIKPNSEVYNGSVNAFLDSLPKPFRCSCDSTEFYEHSGENIKCQNCGVLLSKPWSG